MEQPLVSIVTPVYNSDKYFEECIESVLNQTYQNWEYIIADDQSTDRTIEITKQYADTDNRIKLFRNLENLGHYKNGNYLKTI